MKKAEVQRSTPPDSKDIVEAKKIELIALAGSVILILFLIYTVQIIVSPFLVLGAILFLLYPLRKYSAAKTIMALAAVLFFLWFVYSIQSILAPFVVSLLIAYVLHPFVSKFEQWGIPRWVSSLTIILLFIGIATVVLLLVLPLAFNQLDGMLIAINTIANELSQWLFSGNMKSLLQHYGISLEELKATLSQNFALKLEDVTRALLQGAFGLVSGISSVISRLVNMIIIPFLTFYVLKDFPLIKHRFKLLLPRTQREQAQHYYGRIDELLGRYLRGAITVAMINAVLVTFFFWIFGIQYPLVLGIVAGVLDLIPYFGLMIMMVLSAIVAWFSGEPILLHVILALSTIGILHILEAAVLSPKIIGSKVGMHPVLLILSLLVFSQFLGFVGLLIAVPTTAIIILLVKEMEKSKKQGEMITEILENRINEGPAA